MKFSDFIKKPDIKAGFLYFALIQIEVLIVAFFLSGLPVIFLRFFIDETGPLQTTAEAILVTFIEMIIRFIIFLSIFKNNKSLVYKQFALSYSVTFVLRLIFSLCTYFASFSAGMCVSLIGLEISSTFIDEGIKTMQQVPTLLYIAIFVLFEAITLLVGFFAYRICVKKRNRAHMELHHISN
ncbi:MAG: hypothetical protein IJ039_02345 [Clostridia bacterium]|nr:hypothetical protein [Clostridia bacterium]